MIVSFQGSQLSPGQRRQLEFQRNTLAAFMNSVLSEQVAQTIKAVEDRKEQGLKAERIWFVDRQEIGTLCVAEWMGF
jgi:hypothetical protein